MPIDPSSTPSRKGCGWVGESGPSGCGSANAVTIVPANAHTPLMTRNRRSPGVGGRSPGNSSHSATFPTHRSGTVATFATSATHPAATTSPPPASVSAVTHAA